ncbi:High affinity choline transporter 1 [Dissostichus eleginoides]|uniref:High affinity choline transporter 1 n=1 Tax=Dissostichus eleginoides TaxID=100907 RepID=A0AAD9CNR7_DISEL|nr:High affinity choline transporter 1 [Dissostichus eleginoides]
MNRTPEKKKPTKRWDNVFKAKWTADHEFIKWFCLPFVLKNPSSLNIAQTALNNSLQAPWLGTLPSEKAWCWIDNLCVLSNHQFDILR